MSRTQRPIAAVDCGTNTTRLLVVDEDGRALARELRTTRLGQDVDLSGMLRSDAIARTASALEEFRTILDEHTVGPGRVVATSAVRDASNADEFIDGCSAVIGFPIEIVSGEEEGRLAYVGATRDLAPFEGAQVVIDVGGGSTEIIVGRQSAATAVSLPIGSVRITERHLRSDPPTESQINDAVCTVREQLAAALRQVSGTSPPAASRRLIGLAGTVTTLSALAHDIDVYDFTAVHHSELTIEDVEWWTALLLRETRAQRLERDAIAEGRVDIIAAGALILRECMSIFELQHCLVSGKDVLDGIVQSVLDAGLEPAVD